MLLVVRRLALSPTARMCMSMSLGSRSVPRRTCSRYARVDLDPDALSSCFMPNIQQGIPCYTCHTSRNVFTGSSLAHTEHSPLHQLQSVTALHWSRELLQQQIMAGLQAGSAQDLCMHGRPCKTVM